MTMLDSYENWDVRACFLEIKLVLCLLQNGNIFKTIFQSLVLTVTSALFTFT